MCNCASRIMACRRAYSDLPNAVRIVDARGSEARGTVFPVGNDTANKPGPVIAHIVASLPHYVAFHAACIFADFFPSTNQTRANVPLTATPLAHYRHDISVATKSVTGPWRKLCAKKPRETLPRQKNSIVLAARWHRDYFFVCGQTARACLHKMAAARCNGYSGRL